VILSLIAKSFAYDWKVDEFVNYDQSTKGENKDSDFYRDYYLNDKWKEKLSSQAVELINENVDLHIMNHFGYEKL
jgi:hypothetical protein